MLFDDFAATNTKVQANFTLMFIYDVSAFNIPY